MHDESEILDARVGLGGNGTFSRGDGRLPRTTGPTHDEHDHVDRPRLHTRT